MAVNLLGSGNALVALPSVTTLGGLTEFACCITVNISSIANGERIVGQWGSVGRSFLVTVQDTDEIGFTVASGESSANFFGVKTTATNFTTGLYRLGFRWRAQAGTDDCEIWANGSLLTTTAWFSGTVTAMQSVTDDIEIGHETESVIDGVDGDYSEFAAWGSYLTSDIMQALTKGFSPGFYDANRLHYVKMINTGSLVDLDGNSSPTNSSGTDAQHPPMFYPAPGRVGKAITASGATIAVPSANTVTLQAGTPTITAAAGATVISPVATVSFGAQTPRAKGGASVRPAAASVLLSNAAPSIVAKSPATIVAAAPSILISPQTPSISAASSVLDTGFVIAGSGSDNSGFGSVAWSNPTRITADDASNATASNSNSTDSTHYLISGSHGFAVPSDATIVGIEARIQALEAPGAAIFERVRLVKGGVVQSAEDKSTGAGLTTSAVDYDFGGPADLWSNTWTPADINAAGFGVACAFIITGASANVAAVDAVWIKVYYTTAAASVSPGASLISLDTGIPAVVAKSPAAVLSQLSQILMSPQVPTISAGEVSVAVPEATILFDVQQAFIDATKEFKTAGVSVWEGVSFPEGVTDIRMTVGQAGVNDEAEEES